MSDTDTDGGVVSIINASDAPRDPEVPGALKVVVAAFPAISFIVPPLNVIAAADA